MSDTEPTSAGSSRLVDVLSMALARGLVAGHGAAAPHLGKVKVANADELASRLNAVLKPALDSILGDALASIDPDHPISRLWDSPPSGDPLTPIVAPGSTGITGDLENLIINFTGILGAALGMLPRLGSIVAQPLVNQLNAQIQGQPIPPADLADMVERNIMTEADAAAEAALSGLDASRFANLVLDTGEPPGVIDMLRLWRRGLLDTATLETMIAYSRIRTEWTPQVELLAYDTMSGADAVEATLKGVVDQDTGRTLFEQAGGLGDQFATILATAGNPIGVEKAWELWQHGLISEDTFQTVVLHSRINPQFYPLAQLVGLKWLSTYQVEQAVKAGTVDPKTALSWLTEDGYPADQAAAFVTAVSGGTASGTKAATESMITTLYQARMLTLDEATAALQNLGYSSDEIPLLLELADARRELSQQNAVVTRVRAAYLLGRITDADARQDLAAVQVTSAAADDYLQAWTVEKATEVRALTMAQVGNMVKNGYITTADALSRWAAMGYDQTDAGLLLAYYTGVPPTGSPAAIEAASTSS